MLVLLTQQQGNRKWSRLDISALLPNSGVWKRREGGGERERERYVYGE